MKLNLFRKICFLFTIALVGISVTFAGCDLGTYQQRLDQHNSMEKSDSDSDDGNGTDDANSDSDQDSDPDDSDNRDDDR